MTEAEWLHDIDPIRKLEFLEGKAGDRKLMLYASVCCRRIWHLYLDVRCQRAVEVMELFLEGERSMDEVVAAANDADCAYIRACKDKREIAKRIDGRFLRDRYPPYVRARLARNVAETARHFAGDAFRAAYCASIFARYAAGDCSPQSLFGMTPQHEPEGSTQDLMLKDVFGNPFRRVKPTLYRFAPEVGSLARRIYEEWGFDRMPARPADFLRWYFRPEMTEDVGKREWARRCIQSLPDELRGVTGN